MKFIDERGHLKGAWDFWGICFIILAPVFWGMGLVRMAIKETYIFSIIFFIIGILLISFSQYLFWLNNSDYIDRITFMSFKHWKNFSKINPDKWHLEGKGCGLINPYKLYFLNISDAESSRYKKFDDYRFFCSSRIIKVNFSYFDYLLFLFYHNSLIHLQKKKHKRENKNFINNNLRIILEATQKDIDKMKKEADTQISSAKQEIEEINFRWNNELKKKDKPIKLKL